MSISVSSSIPNDTGYDSRVFVLTSTTVLVVLNVGTCKINMIVHSDSDSQQSSDIINVITE